MSRRPESTRRSRRLFALAACSGIIAAACSGGNDESLVVDDTTIDSTSATTDDSETERSSEDQAEGFLADVALDPAVTQELNRVRFAGVDADSDLSGLELYLEIGNEHVQLPLYADDFGLYAVAPLHPTNPGAGGVATLELRAGEASSGGLELELKGLDPAPGAWDAMVDDLIDELDARARDLGSSFEAVSQESFETVEPMLLPIKLAQSVVDDGTTNDLESLINDATDDEAALIDAIVAKVGLLGLFDERVAQQPQGFLREPTTRDPSAGHLLTSKPVRALQADCLTIPLTITNGAQLAQALATGVDSVVAEGGAEQQVLEDIDTLTSEASQIPGIGSAIGLVGTGFTAIQSLVNMAAGIYPTTLTSISADVSTTQFNEDFKNDGTVDRVMVTAASTGFDASEIVAGLGKAALEKLGGKLADRLSAGETDEVAQMALEHGGDLRNSALGAYVDAVTAGFYNICPQQWTVDITASDYVAIDPSIGRITVDQAALTYKPVELGDDVLTIRAKAEAFSGQTVDTRIDVVTKPIRVIVDSDTPLVESPGDTITITARVENADTPTLHWNPGNGTWNDGVGEDTNDGRSRPHLTPSNKTQYSYLVVVESTSTTGLRATSTEPRNDSVEVKLKGLFVKPDPGSVGVRKQLQFTATDRDGNPREVTWTATGGTISPTGVYTAGDEPGFYTVTARLVDDPSQTETVTVEVIDAKCLVGTWDLREQEFLDQIGAASGFSATYVGGQYRIVIRDDGSYTGIRDDWTFQIDTPDGSILITITSEDPGSWNKTGESTLTISDSGSNATVKMSIMQGGGWIAVPGGVQNVDIPGISGTGQFVCEGNELTVTTDGITASMVRIGPAT